MWILPSGDASSGFDGKKNEREYSEKLEKCGGYRCTRDGKLYCINTDWFCIVPGYGGNKYLRYMAVAIEDRSKVKERYEAIDPVIKIYHLSSGSIAWIARFEKTAWFTSRNTSKNRAFIAIRQRTQTAHARYRAIIIIILMKIGHPAYIRA